MGLGAWGYKLRPRDRVGGLQAYASRPNPRVLRLRMQVWGWPDEPDLADPGLDWRGEERGWKGKRGQKGAGGGWWPGNLAVWQPENLPA